MASWIRRLMAATAKFNVVERLARLTDRQVLHVFLGWLVFRMAGNRLGLASMPTLLERTPWAVPLLRNGIVSVTAAVVVAADRPATLAGIALASFAMSIIGAEILFLGGYRFGPMMFPTTSVERARRWLDRGGVAAVAVGATGLFPVPITLMAGVCRMRPTRFLMAFAAGAVGRVAVIVWLGSTAAKGWPWLPDRIGDIALLSSGAWILVAVAYAVVIDRRQGRPARVLISTWQQSRAALILRGDVLAGGRTSFVITVVAKDDTYGGTVRLRDKAGVRFDGRVTRWDRARDGFRVVAIGDQNGSADVTVEVVVRYRQSMSLTVRKGEDVLHAAGGPLPGAQRTQVETAQ